MAGGCLFDLNGKAFDVASSEVTKHICACIDEVPILPVELTGGFAKHKNFTAKYTSSGSANDVDLAVGGLYENVKQAIVVKKAEAEFCYPKFEFKEEEAATAAHSV